jgi:phosphate:Na+ symporter
MPDEPFSLLPMLIGLAGGLALFLHGMTMMSNAMRAMAGSKLKSIMARLAGNRVSALLTGVVLTAVVQSSSVTSVIAIGFVSAGILSLGQALAVIMGAAVGSTVTAQIIAFDVSNLSFLLVAVGFGLSMWKSRRIPSLVGTVLMGLGILFIGLSMMSGFMAPLRAHQPFLDLMSSMTNPLLGILIGAVFTAVVQSSSATLGVVIALASQGLIPLQAGIALVFGANIGTTITGLLATIGQPRGALHAAIGLFSFKLLLVLVWLPLMGPLERITRAVSPAAPDLAPTEQLAYEVPRQVANVHMIVNVTTVLLLLPFTNLLAGLIIRAVGEDKREEQTGVREPELNPLLLDMPPLALDAARRELIQLGERVGEMLDAAGPAILEGRSNDIEALHKAEQHINRHHAALVGFIEQVLHADHSPEIGRGAMDLAEAADYLEAIADLVDREMIPLHRRHQEKGTENDPQSRERLRALSEAVRFEFRRALQAVGEGDLELAASVMESKAQVREMERATIEFPIDEDSNPGPRRLRPSALERELVEALRRGYSLIRRFARVGTGLHRAENGAAAARDKESSPVDFCTP